MTQQLNSKPENALYSYVYITAKALKNHSYVIKWGRWGWFMLPYLVSAVPPLYSALIISLNDDCWFNIKYSLFMCVIQLLQSTIAVLLDLTNTWSSSSQTIVLHCILLLLKKKWLQVQKKQRLIWAINVAIFYL